MVHPIKIKLLAQLSQNLGIGLLNDWIKFYEINYLYDTKSAFLLGELPHSINIVL